MQDYMVKTIGGHYGWVVVVKSGALQSTRKTRMLLINPELKLVSKSFSVKCILFIDFITLT